MSDYKPDDLMYWDNECSKAAKEYEDYVHQEKMFQVLSSALLASLVMSFKKDFPTESNVSLEMRAKASSTWRDFMQEQMKLLKEAGKRWIHYEDCNRRWESARSMLAARREEFRRIS